MVKRQQERDVATLLPAISQLTERQHQLFFLVHSLIARHKPEGFGRLVDDDVAQAAGAVAATLETAARGVVYEHSPASVPAQRLAREITAMLAEVRAQGTKIYDSEGAIALRAVERGSLEVHKVAADERAYLSLMARLLRVRPGHQPGDTPTGATGSLIVP